MSGGQRINIRLWLEDPDRRYGEYRIGQRAQNCVADRGPEQGWRAIG